MVKLLDSKFCCVFPPYFMYFFNDIGRNKVLKIIRQSEANYLPSVGGASLIHVAWKLCYQLPLVLSLLTLPAILGTRALYVTMQCLARNRILYTPTYTE